MLLPLSSKLLYQYVERHQKKKKNPASYTQKEKAIAMIMCTAK